MMTLVLATRNSHKADEIVAVLGDGYRCLTLAEYPGAPPVVEDAADFAGNATKKALSLARWLSARGIEPATGRWLVLADDSGLEVDALDGAPGVHSARFAALDSNDGANSTDEANNRKLLAMMEEVPTPRRTARFRCVIALAEVGVPDRIEPRLELCEGACEGLILTAPRGDGGFGYDPLFQPTGYTESFAELGETTKNRISHRAAALSEVKVWMEASRLGS